MLVAADSLGSAPNLSLVEPAARVPTLKFASDRADFARWKELVTQTAACSK
jgi:hypothetical protein